MQRLVTCWTWQDRYPSIYFGIQARSTKQQSRPKTESFLQLCNTISSPNVTGIDCGDFRMMAVLLELMANQKIWVNLSALRYKHLQGKLASQPTLTDPSHSKDHCSLRIVLIVQPIFLQSSSNY
jgi:hypothetical protein